MQFSSSYFPNNSFYLFLIEKNNTPIDEIVIEQNINKADFSSIKFKSNTIIAEKIILIQKTNDDTLPEFSGYNEIHSLLRIGIKKPDNINIKNIQTIIFGKLQNKIEINSIKIEVIKNKIPDIFLIRYISNWFKKTLVISDPKKYPNVTNA